MIAQELEFTSKLGKKRIFFSGDQPLVQTILDEIYTNEIYKPLVEVASKVDKPTILDIGAHIGLASLYFTQIPNVMIHSVEPNPNNFAMLRENVKDFPKITPHRVAIGGTNAKRYLYGYTEAAMRESFYATEGERMEVSAVTLKTFIEHNKLDHIEAMKIDVEGAEYEIFLLPEFKEIAPKIDFIIGEAHYQPGVPPMIRDLLEPLGYKVEFLPWDNLSETYRVKFEDGTIFEVTTKLQTMFTARR